MTQTATQHQHPDSGATLIHDGRTILAASEAAARMLGHDRTAEIIGTSLIDLVAPAHREILKRQFQAVLSGEQTPPAQETSVLREDGSRLRVVLNSTPGRHDRAPAVQTLLTALPGSGSAPLLSREHYRTLIESTLAILWEGHPETFDFSYVSPEAEKLLGYPVERWIHESGFWADHIHPDDREWAVRYCARASSEGRQHTFDYRMIAADGRVVWLRDVVNVILHDGKPVKLVGVMIDITETKRTEESLSRLANLQRSMVEISQTFIADRDNLDDRIQRALSLMGRHVDVDRSYLFRISDDGGFIDNTHEWCAEGIESQIDKLQGIPADAGPMMIATLQRHEVVHIPDVSGLGEDWSDDRAMLAAQGIQSVVFVPIVVEERLYGFIGFDAVRTRRAWPQDEIQMLSILGEIMGSTIQAQRAEQALRRSEATRSRAETLSRSGSWEWDIARDRFSPSREWCQVTGYPHRELSREEVMRMVHADELPQIEKMLQHTLETGEPYCLEHRVYHGQTGELRWLRVNADVVIENGAPVRMYGMAQDITDRRAAEESLAASEARYRSVVNSIGEVVFQTDTRGFLTFLNPAWFEITRNPIDESIGRHFLDFVHPGDKASLRSEIEPMVRGQVNDCDYEARCISRDGTLHWMQVTVRLTRDEHGEVNGTAGTMRDITRQREAEQRMEHLARHDPLTELPNRVLATDRLDQMIKAARHRGSCLAAILVDIDNFKKVNDTLGHALGDRMLKEAAYRLQDVVGERDTVARMGGDEFLVLIPDLRQPDDAVSTVERIQEAFRRPFRLDGHNLVFSASLGIAAYPNDGPTAHEIMRNADIALYESKLAGRNTYHFFTASMNREATRLLTMEEALRGALSGDEFTVVYQPVIDLESEQVVGAEALLRWHNAALGHVPPSEFIPVAEQTNLIRELGNFVLERALQQARIWRREYRESFHVSVNVSPQQFRDTGLAEHIAQRLEHYELPGSALEIEITEGVLLSGMRQVSDTLHRLRELGVGIAMDDFGTGYASLSYLREYPFDTLKVDRTFVQGSTSKMNDRELVLTSLRLARGLNLRAVAEGVETAEQVELLRENGCRFVQGYYYGKPVPAGEFRMTVNPGEAGD